MMNGNGNGRQLSKKKTVQVLVIFTILAWATQTLLHQWGFGATIEPATQPANAEKFVPGSLSSGFSSGTNLEMRSEATIVGNEVRLKQVCRWSDADAGVFSPIADLVLTRLGTNSPYRSISIADIKSTLHDAGVNVAAINFVGAASCAVNRGDVHVDEGEALQKWLDSHGAADEASAAPANPLASAPTTAPSVTLAAATTHPEPKLSHTLGDFLTEDLSTRLGLPIEKLQIAFHPQDQRVLNLAEPLFKFQIQAQRVRDLGEVSWNVTIVAEGTTQRVQIGATARAWQNQLVVAKPMSFKQVIRDQDVIERRTLVDRLPDDTVLDKSQALGQQASRDLKPGQILTARMVDAVQLVRAGQFVTVVYKQESIELKTVARALDSGSFGQTIRVKNEATRDIFEVILTGPQTASMSTPASTAPKVATGQ